MIESYTINSIDRSEVLRYLGYRNQELTAGLSARIDAAMRRSLALARPRASIRFFDVCGRAPQADGTPAIQLAGTALELAGASMQAHMADAVAVGVMAATIGMGVEQELRRLSLTDPVGQLLFDAAATATVERCADAAEASIVAEAARRGLYANQRFSPGYGDLPLQTQGTLLATLDAQRHLGITLSPTLLMSPTKSVTAVVGLCRTPQPTSRSSCASCFCRTFCMLRKTTGRTCHD